AVGPAMDRSEAEALVERGLQHELDAKVLALGEMGIGNTTVAGALAARLLGVEPEAVCGHGTGLDDEGVARKVDIVRRSLLVNRASEPMDVLAELGGRELAFLAGVAIGASRPRAVVLLDGFISSTAALVAARLEPSARAPVPATHRPPD